LRATGFALLLLGSIFLAAPALGLPAPAATYYLSIDESGSYWTVDPNTAGATIDDGDGTFTFTGSADYAEVDVTWNMTVKEDPFINAVLGITNNTANPQTYLMIVTLPAFPPFGSGLMGGPSTITVNDSNFSGAASMSSVGLTDTIYNGQVDGVNALPLLGPGLTLSCAFGGCINFTGAVAGLPGPTLPYAPGLVANISIRHRFTLSPGDSATFNSFFIINPIPEPGTAVLGLLGLVALGLARRLR
jgi:hypothetical protein